MSFRSSYCTETSALSVNLFICSIDEFYPGPRLDLTHFIELSYQKQSAMSFAYECNTTICVKPGVMN